MPRTFFSTEADVELLVLQELAVAGVKVERFEVAGRPGEELDAVRWSSEENSHIKGILVISLVRYIVLITYGFQVLMF